MIFHRYKVDAKISNAFWNGKGNMKLCSQLLIFKIRTILGPQIKIR
jgi:hypothetical protein